MALNWTMLDSELAPVPLPNENTITTVDSGVEVTLKIPDAAPSVPATSGGLGGGKSLKEVGRVWLTDQRLIFVTTGQGQHAFESLSMPLHAIISTKFEQPFLGSNYLALDVKPTADGGLTDGTKAEIRLKDQGLFGFVSILEKTRERSIYMKRQVDDDEEGLPMYTSPTGPGPSAALGPSMHQDNPPGYDA